MPELTIAPKATKELQQLYTKTKTKIPKEEQTNVVCKIECKARNCRIPFYIGETERNAKTRGPEHKKDFKDRHRELKEQHNVLAKSH